MINIMDEGSLGTWTKSASELQGSAEKSETSARVLADLGRAGEGEGRHG